MTEISNKLSIIIPAKNEEEGLAKLLPLIKESYPEAEIIVVNDGSTDGTSDICKQYGIRQINHPYSMGNGAAVKSGARSSSGDILFFMDADGQHNVADIRTMLDELENGYDMVIGARDFGSHANYSRLAANVFYNKLSSLISGHKVLDLTSGLRAVKADKFTQFLDLLPNGFSYPTTITMAFFRAGYPIAYTPIKANKRLGKSHIRPVRDGLRFLLIIFRIGTLYSPLKIFLPMSLFFFMSGAGYYLFTYITEHRFTNMSALLLSVSVIIFLIGLVSEQITGLLYIHISNRQTEDQK